MTGSVLCLVGPTGVGKTELAFRLAQPLGAEIISCDSMQVYRGMERLTQAPPTAMRQAVPHHLVACIEPEETYNAARYAREAGAVVRELLGRGTTPLVVGGTGLYLRALLDGVSEAPPADEAVRRGLTDEAEAGGNAALHARLQGVDPQAAAKIHVNDRRRIIRALEVYTVTGRPLSQQWDRRGGLAHELPVTVVALNRPRAELYARLDRRVERMVADGVVEEVGRLRQRKLSVTAAQALGLKEFGGALDGAYDLSEAVRRVQTAMHAYARGQLTWFRADARLRWFELTDEASVELAVEAILERSHGTSAARHG